MLKDLNDDEYMDMFKELGISTWGHRRMLKKAVQDIKDNIDDNTANEVNRTESNVVHDSAILAENDSAVEESSYTTLHEQSNSTTLEISYSVVEESSITSNSTSLDISNFRDDPIDCEVCNKKTPSTSVLFVTSHFVSSFAVFKMGIVQVSM